MIIINFSHPITPEQIEQIEKLYYEQYELTEKVEQVIDIPVAIQNDKPIMTQVNDLIRQFQAAITPAQGNDEVVLINLPGLAIVAAIIAVWLVDSGYFNYTPLVMRVAPVAGSLPPKFNVVELVEIEAITL